MTVPAQKSAAFPRPIPDQWRQEKMPVPQWTAINYVAAAIVSILFWLFIGEASDTSAATTAGVLVIGSIVLLTPFLFAQHQIVSGLTVLAYLVAMQPAIRAYIPTLRYNILEYALPLSVFFILTQRRKFVLSIPTFFYLLYLGLELVGVINTQRLDIMRGVFFASFTLFLILLVANQIKLPMEKMTHIWQGYLVGALSVLVLLARILFSEEVITWTTGSNSQLTAGMGPNQVSFILSVAVFFALVLGDNATGYVRWFYRLLAGIFAYFMILTFSRGGLYIVTGAILLYYLFFQRPKRSSWTVLLIFGVLLYSALTVARGTTQGVVLKRYSDLDTSNRIILVEQGWRIFLENPAFGVGTANYHTTVSSSDYFGVASGAHNELIRAAAEHGVFGLVFWGLFAFSSFVTALKGYSGRLRALRLALLFIAFVSMFYNGLKLVIQPLLILMAFTLIAQDVSQEEMTSTDTKSLSIKALPHVKRLQLTRKTMSEVSPKGKRLTHPVEHGE